MLECLMALMMMDEMVQKAPPRAQVCFVCHGQNGIGLGPDNPNLAGQKKNYLVKQLKDFRSKERKHDVMNGIAVTLTDKDIEELAKYFSEMK